ncbi:MAG: hypothetical protein WCI17_06675 [bacterium]
MSRATQLTGPKTGRCRPVLMLLAGLTALLGHGEEEGAPPATGEAPSPAGPVLRFPAPSAAPASRFTMGSAPALATPPAAASVPAPAAPAAPEVVLRDNRRDPFWPVDMVRPVQAGAKADLETAVRIGEAEWRTVEKVLRETVRGVSRLPARNGQNEYLALVNGKFVAVGGTVILAANGKNYRWKVASMTLKGGPVFERILSTPSTPPVKK